MTLRGYSSSGLNWLRQACVAIVAIILLYGTATDAIAANTWPMYQGNPSHSGYLPISLNPSIFSLRWQHRIGTLDLNPVTAADGKVFVSELGYFNNPGLYVLDVTEGEVLWSQHYGSVFSVNPPSYAYGNVYIQTGNHSTDTWLRAYKADTGELVFKSAHSAQWERYYSPTIYNGSVYVNGGYYGGMYAFDAYTGEQLWFQELPQYGQWTPAIDENWAYAYVGEYFPGLYVTDRFTGEPVFDIPDPNFDWNGWSMNLAPVLGEENDVLAIHDGRLISFDLSTQDIRWQLYGTFTGQPSVANGVLYAISAGALTVRDEVTGNLLWAWEPPGGESLKGTIIVTDSHLFLQTSSTVYAVDLEIHQDVWSYPASGHLSIGEGMLYIAGNAGLLTAINLTSPDIVREPSDINFGKVKVGQSQTKSFLIRNAGDGVLNVSTIVNLNPPFALLAPQPPFSVAPGETTVVMLAFTPTKKGKAKGIIAVNSNDADEPKVEVILNGIGY